MSLTIMSERKVLSDEPIGPVHRHFAWKPRFTLVGTKWLVMVRRQRWERRVWERYWDDPTHGNGGGDYVEETRTEQYWRYGSCGTEEML